VYTAGWAAGRDQVATSAFPVNTQIHAAALASWRGYVKQPELLRRLAAFAAPYLAILGSEDVRPSWPVEQLVRLLPRGELVVIDGAGHCLWWTHRVELRDGVSRFRAPDEASLGGGSQPVR